MADIFISYRRNPSIDRAIRLKELLEKKGYNVYLDTQMGAGQFDEILIGEIRKCTYFLLLITDDAFERCWEEKDVFRMEIECARYNSKTIIPILNPGYQFPEKMPASIDFLRYCNGVEIAPHLLAPSVDDLIERMLHAETDLKKKSALSGEINTEVMQHPESSTSFVSNSITTQYMHCPHCGSETVHSVRLCDGKDWEYWFLHEKSPKKSTIKILLALISLLSMLATAIFSALAMIGVIAVFKENIILQCILAIIYISGLVSIINYYEKTENLWKTSKKIKKAIIYCELQLWIIKCGGCDKEFHILYPKSEDILKRIRKMKKSQ